MPAGKHINENYVHNLSQEQIKAANLLKALELQLEQEKTESIKTSVKAVVSFLQQLKRGNRFNPEQKLVLQRIYYQLFTYLGKFFLYQGTSEESLYFWRELYKNNSHDIFVLKKLASTCYTMGQSYLAEAEDLYRKALKIDPLDLEVFDNLGRIISKYPQRKEDTLFAYREALSRCSNDMERIYFYKRILEIEPEDFQVMFRLGKIYARLGMFVEAKRYLQEAFYTGNNKTAGLDLFHAYLSINDIYQAENLLEKLSAEKVEYTNVQKLYRGFLCEKSERWKDALICFQEIPAEDPLFVRAQLGILRALLHLEDYSSAEEFLKNISFKKNPGLQEDYIELITLLDNITNTWDSPQKFLWQDLIRSKDPQYPLKKEIIKKRTFGQAFWRKYEALEVIGKGPCSFLLLCRERNTGRKVAVKQLNLEGDVAAVRRTQGQLRALRDLNSPSLVNIFEDCLYEGNFFYAMEYLETGSLLDYAKGKTPLLITEAAYIALGVSKALLHYYSQNKFTCHGALKPENIFISSEGEIKIGDFDLLWILEGETLYNIKLLKKRPVFIRNFLYMAPEKMSSGKKLLQSVWEKYKQENTNSSYIGEFCGIDQRVDLYSLGVILFELVTGTLPFPKLSVESIITFHRSSRFPSPKRYNSALSSDLEEIIMSLLDPDPRRRFSEPSQLIDALKKARIV